MLEISTKPLFCIIEVHYIKEFEKFLRKTSFKYFAKILQKFWFQVLIMANLWGLIDNLTSTNDGNIWQRYVFFLSYENKKLYNFFKFFLIFKHFKNFCWKCYTNLVSIYPAFPVTLFKFLGYTHLINWWTWHEQKPSNALPNEGGNPHTIIK